MSGIVETVGAIGKTVDEIIDFTIEDEFLSADFEQFLTKNNIIVEKESDFNDILISYFMDGKTQDGIRVLDYFEEKNKNADKKIIQALKTNFISVFQINKITKNCYETTDLISEKNFTLTPLVKTTSLRGIGLFDFIKARVIELDKNYYILEIYDNVGQYREFYAKKEAIKAIIKNPKIAVLNNSDKFLEIKTSIQSFNATFEELFKKDEIIVSNKDTDKLLDDFYNFHLGKIQNVEYKEISPDFNFKFFEIAKYKDDILTNASAGFSDDKEEYDTGIFSDETKGLFVIPFSGTFDKILKAGLGKIENDTDCVKSFLTSDKVPPDYLRKKADENKNFLEIVNAVTGKNFDTVASVIDFYKYDYKDGFKLSPINVLFNSKTFSEVLGHKEEETKHVGRNDLCPCGSGKKYKKCCLNKGE